MSKEPIGIEHGNKEYKDAFIVNWCLGNVCNFSCSYCPPFLHNGDGWLDYETVSSFCKSIIEQVPKHKSICFEFTGGEVTMWKDFIKLCVFLKSQERDIFIALITNGSRTINWWEKAKPVVDKVMLSYHAEGYTTPEDFTKIVEFLRDEKEIHVNVMMHYDHFEKCLNLGKELSKINGISITLQPLLDELDVGSSMVDSYSEEQLNIMNDQDSNISKNSDLKKIVNARGPMNVIHNNGDIDWTPTQNFILKEENSWKGWICAAGTEQIVINAKGKVFRGWCLSDGCIGDVKNKSINLPDNWVVCDKDVCHCNFDITCSKSKVINIVNI